MSQGIMHRAKAKFLYWLLMTFYKEYSVTKDVIITKEPNGGAGVYCKNLLLNGDNVWNTTTLAIFGDHEFWKWEQAKEACTQQLQTGSVSGMGVITNDSATAKEMVEKGAKVMHI